LYEVFWYFPSRSKGKITDGEIDKQGPWVPIFTGSTKFMTPLKSRSLLHISVNPRDLGIRMRIFASRQCVDYARASYAGAGEARVARVTFTVGEAVWYLYRLVVFGYVKPTNLLLSVIVMVSINNLW